MKLKMTKDAAPLSKEPHHHKAPIVWIVVADQEIAHIYKKSGSHLELIYEANPVIRERRKGIPDDSMGRVTSLHGSNRHKLQPRLQPGRHDAINFAQDLSQWLKEAAETESYDRLVLIAAPRTLGDLRPRLHKTVQNRIVAEIDKELTKMKGKELHRQLKKIVWF
ncbi:MAG: host attachment protein [Alphaproteobacteria bacterium PRO2]|nr:host attachment protein [Alphaproteobacteria bacterium PRO2]